MDDNQKRILELTEKLDNYRDERERIKALMCQIGSVDDTKRGKTWNWVFVILVVLLFVFDIARHVFHMDYIPLPPVFSIEIGIFLISAKIIWMINRQEKADHFQFWILNSIEFRLNHLSETINEIQEKVEKFSE